MFSNKRLAKKCCRKIFVSMEKSHNILLNEKKTHHSNTILFKSVSRRGVD